MNRSTTYYERRKPKESPELKEAIEQLYEEDATLGRRRMPVMLHRRYGIKISQKKCAKLKKQLGLRTLYPHRDTSAVNPKAEKKGYILKDIEIKKIDQVWTSVPRWVGVGGIFLARWKDLPVALTPRQRQVYSMLNAFRGYF